MHSLPVTLCLSDDCSFSHKSVTLLKQPGQSRRVNNRTVGKKLVGLVEVDNWGRLAAAALLGAVPVDDGTGSISRVTPLTEGDHMDSAR